jgi:hypothetical protein
LYTSNPELVQVVHQDEAAAAAPVKKEFHGLKLASQHANIVSESILAQLNMVNLLRQVSLFLSSFQSLLATTHF